MFHFLSPPVAAYWSLETFPLATHALRSKSIVSSADDLLCANVTFSGGVVVTSLPIPIKGFKSYYFLRGAPMSSSTPLAPDWVR